MPEMSDYLHKEKQKYAPVFDTTKKSEFMKEEFENPYAMAGSIQAPPPGYMQSQKTRAKYSPQEMQAYGKLVDRILKTGTEGINPEEEGCFFKNEKKLLDIARCVKAYDNANKMYPELYRDISDSNKQELKTKMKDMRKLYSFYVSEKRKAEEDKQQQYAKQRPAMVNVGHRKVEVYRATEESDEHLTNAMQDEDVETQRSEMEQAVRSMDYFGMET